jgi:hypothetical protein
LHSHRLLLRLSARPGAPTVLACLAPFRQPRACPILRKSQLFPVCGELLISVENQQLATHTLELRVFGLL